MGPPSLGPAHCSAGRCEDRSQAAPRGRAGGLQGRALEVRTQGALWVRAAHGTALSQTPGGGRPHSLLSYEERRTCKNPFSLSNQPTSSSAVLPKGALEPGSGLSAPPLKHPLLEAAGLTGGPG